VLIYTKKNEIIRDSFLDRFCDLIA